MAGRRCLRLVGSVDEVPKVSGTVLPLLLLLVLLLVLLNIAVGMLGRRWDRGAWCGESGFAVVLRGTVLRMVLLL